MNINFNNLTLQEINLLRSLLEETVNSVQPIKRPTWNKA